MMLKNNGRLKFVYITFWNICIEWMREIILHSFDEFFDEANMHSKNEIVQLIVQMKVIKMR